MTTRSRIDQKALLEVELRGLFFGHDACYRCYKSFYSSSLAIGQSKLVFCPRLGFFQFYGPLLCRLGFPAKSAGDKHSNLFCLTVSDDEKLFIKSIPGVSRNTTCKGKGWTLIKKTNNLSLAGLCGERDNF